MDSEKTDFTFEDYKKMLDKAEDAKKINSLLAELVAIKTILVEKELTTIVDFKSYEDKALEEIMKTQYEQLSDKDKSAMNTLKRFNDLMGGKF